MSRPHPRHTHSVSMLTLTEMHEPIDSWLVPGHGRVWAGSSCRRYNLALVPGTAGRQPGSCCDLAPRQQLSCQISVAIAVAILILVNMQLSHWPRPSYNSMWLTGRKASAKLVNMVLNVHRNHKAYQGRGKGGGREIIYLSLHCHHQNDSCIKMGSDEMFH